MYRAAQPLAIVLPLLFLGLFIPAGIALYRTRTFALPIPLSLSIATILAPPITAVLLRSAQFLTRPTHNTLSNSIPPFSFPAAAIIVALTIYDVVIITLSLTHVVPSEVTECALQKRWGWLRHTHQVDTIKRIQDRNHCCGFNSPKDMAWPFPDGDHTVSPCREVFGRHFRCKEGWTVDTQTAAGLMGFVGLVLILIKVIVVIVYRVHNSSTNPDAPSYRRLPFSDTEEGRKREQRQKGKQKLLRAQADRYRDELDPRPSEQSDVGARPAGPADEANRGGRGGVVQPSLLHGEGEEWRSS